jgi:hypothetical protein
LKNCEGVILDEKVSDWKNKFGKTGNQAGGYQKIGQMQKNV